MVLSAEIQLVFHLCEWRAGLVPGLIPAEREYGRLMSLSKAVSCSQYLPLGRVEPEASLVPSQELRTRVETVVPSF